MWQINAGCHKGNGQRVLWVGGLPMPNMTYTMACTFPSLGLAEQYAATFGLKYYSIEYVEVIHE